MRPGVLAGIGGFGALFEVPKQFKEPVLVSGTDGVGTKLRLAFEWNRHDTVGIDLVAMSVNDILVQGAEPLFFLDYFACGKLSVDTAASVVGGIAKGCELSGCALIGGETAEMPGMYPDGEYDLAGFAVGAVEKSAIIDGKSIKTGDVVLGLASSGAHSNGYSLVRKILERANARPDQDFHGQPLVDVVMAPTRIYVKQVLAALAKHGTAIKGLAHITGGGLLDNVPRILQPGLSAKLHRDGWEMPSCSSGCSSRAAWKTPKCTASSTAASAWCWWWTPPRPTPSPRPCASRARPSTASARSSSSRTAWRRLSWSERDRPLNGRQEKARYGGLFHFGRQTEGDASVTGSRPRGRVRRVRPARRPPRRSCAPPRPAPGNRR